MAKIKKVLSAEVAAKYDLVKIEPAKLHFNGYGVIDLTTLSLENADALVKRGFPYLVLKQAPAPEKVSIPPVK